MLANILSIYPNGSSAQKIFDVIFGIIAPILCLIYDPFIFHLAEGQCGAAMFPQYAPFVYTAVGLGVCLLAVWLAFEERLKIVSAFFAGVFTLGFTFVLFLSISTIVPLIMTCGLLPPLIALVYWRNGIKALRQSQEQPPPVSFILIMFGIVIVLGVSVLAQHYYPPVVPIYTPCPAPE